MPTNSATDEHLVRFARRISHDLNNFSTVVVTYSELLLADLAPDTPAHSDVREIQQAAEAMVAYLQRVTRFARAANMKRSPVAVDAGITNAVRTFQQQTPDRPVTVAATTDATISADPVWWSDVVTELLMNAHESAPVGTPITVTASVTDGRLALEVRDEGPGVPASLGDTVAAPFITGKEGVRGAGMGLTLVAAFLGALDGTLEFVRDGNATVARLSLPTV